MSLRSVCHSRRANRFQTQSVQNQDPNHSLALTKRLFMRARGLLQVRTTAQIFSIAECKMKSLYLGRVLTL